MTTLLELIANLDSTDDSLTICVEKSPGRSGLSEAELLPSDRVSRDSRLPYFLEVAVAKDVLSAWTFARNGRMPSLAEKCEALIYFEENAAYFPESGIKQDSPSH